ncbi:YhcH/YjgK/YiaL family protein [Vibrio mediterranei]|uniref:YhcH/YjgK/YiaL family protein n=1 Tax=Vibrio mediterranei TaxID=689 RepID=UPI001EFEC7F2|nr:YhcH/YjgK/YiaL family protein [Vibrio mediterranei]MCG9626390.1 YhcH/YjgK/YiaL family protein [Vibrio mediterranei]
MVVSSLNAMDRSKTLGQIIQHIINDGVDTYPNGLTEVSGSDVFVNRIRGQAKDVEDALVEVHDEYIDIHLVLSGKEKLGYSLRVNESEDELEKFVDDAKLSRHMSGEQFVILEQGNYCVFLPGEWHRPMLKALSDDHIVDKVVIKVRASLL